MVRSQNSPPPPRAFHVTGTVVAGAGTALLPSITNTGDLNTGMWFPAADTIAFSEGGVEALRIDSSGGASIEAYKSNGTSTNYQYGMWLKTRTHGGSMDDRLFMDQVQTVFNETGADTDFRVESDTNTHALFVEGSSGNVGIGTSSPSFPLSIQSNSSAEALLILGRSADDIGEIAFRE
jgi:hypothetical protein